MKVTDELKRRTVYFDGGYGTVLIDKGLSVRDNPSFWNLTNPDVIFSIHKDYISAGADIITTNTFSANRFQTANFRECVKAGVDIAYEAASSCNDRKIYVALDIGPCGKMLKPYGTLDFEDAVQVYADIINAADLGKVDLVLIETFSECLDTKAAVIAAKENTELPIFVSNTYDKDGRLLTGTEPEAMAAMLEGLRVDAIGCNCSSGPDLMIPTFRRLAASTDLPLFANPNAGLPRNDNGRYVYDMSASEFAGYMTEFVKAGASSVGGCCGTDHTYISETVARTADIPRRKAIKEKRCVISSGIKSLTIGEIPLIIGERINPTGKPKLKEALRNNNIEYLINEGVKQQEAGAHILDVNVGLPEVSEKDMLPEAVMQIQASTELPLQIDTVDPAALERALRVYAGKPLINSVNGKQQSMDAVLPLAAKYGGAIVALTLDEKGIPATARERADIAARIVKEAEKYGISRNDIIADPLALAVSSDKNSALVTLEAIDLIKKELGISVSLGVSNISFGLPNREWINSAFYGKALTHGLDLAIINPLSVEMIKAYKTHMLLSANDEGCNSYIAFASVNSISATETVASAGQNAETSASSLEDAIIGGMKQASASFAAELLKSETPDAIISGHIVPALDTVGKNFESKKSFLPQLLMSAEAASAAFDEVKRALPVGDSGKGSVILATVHGDLHDIGKNIVKTMLQSYGFSVIDLGKDTPPEKVLNAVLENNVKLVGLSALMTTTIPAMKETIELLKSRVPDVFVIVGGAVLTADYAKAINADAYAEDAMETVRIADKYYSE